MANLYYWIAGLSEAENHTYAGYTQADCRCMRQKLSYMFSWENGEQCLFLC